MKIIVLGSGVIGTTSAYYLALAGHEVTVIDRQTAPALETSYANAGEVSPGYSSPWAGPGVPLKAIQWLLMKHRPLVVRPQFSMHQWGWMLQMLKNCTEARYAVNKERMVRLAEYSRDVLKQLREDTNIQYDQRTQGTLQLFRTQKQLDATGKDIQVLKDSGVPFELLDQAGFLKHEPGLAMSKDKFVGALLLPGDETGDCFKFTQNLAKMAEALGVKFKFGVNIQGLLSSGGAINGVKTDEGILTADQYLVCMGSYSPQLLRPLGLRLPIYPVKGYSLTLPVINEAQAPESTVMDETHKVAVTRLGSRIRIGGTAELAGFNLDLHQSRRETLEHVVSDLYPEGVDLSKGEFWTGLRPMTPDGTPILGATDIKNLYLATGHGTLGWTMAAGTGRVIADIMSQREPEISTAGLALDRYKTE